jgi:hypothetical protein
LGAGATAAFLNWLKRKMKTVIKNSAQALCLEPLKPVALSLTPRFSEVCLRDGYPGAVSTACGAIDQTRRNPTKTPILTVNNGN